MPHTFPYQLNWTGNSLQDPYVRDGVVTKDGAPDLAVSSAPGYMGDPARWNPEELLGAALSTCHMLTFLALAAKNRIEVKHYEDRAEAILDTVEKVTKITQVHLRPTITVAPGTDAAKVVELFEKAHKYCFIANSVAVETVMAPVVQEG